MNVLREKKTRTISVYSWIVNWNINNMAEIKASKLLFDQQNEKKNCIEFQIRVERNFVFLSKVFECIFKTCFCK